MLRMGKCGVAAIPLLVASQLVVPPSAGLASTAVPIFSETDCLTAAIYYEARSESEEGQRAVAQVVLNRVRHPAYPNSVCGVVFQGSQRSSGCQFSFTCDGSLAHRPRLVAWARASQIASDALAGRGYAPVGDATHYHTKAVLPYWSHAFRRLGAVGDHIFYSSSRSQLPSSQPAPQEAVAGRAPQGGGGRIERAVATVAELEEKPLPDLQDRDDGDTVVVVHRLSAPPPSGGRSGRGGTGVRVYRGSSEPSFR